MIDRNHDLTVTRRAELSDISRGSVHYPPRPVSGADLALMRRIDELHLEHPFMGARMLRDQLRRECWGTPEIVNTDQGSQFTAGEFTAVVLAAGCKLSMDGRGAWRDNVFAERPWRSVKYERGVPEGLRQRQRGPHRHCRSPALVQRASSPFQPEAVDAR